MKEVDISAKNNRMSQRHLNLVKFEVVYKALEETALRWRPGISGTPTSENDNRVFKDLDCLSANLWTNGRTNIDKNEIAPKVEAIPKSGIISESLPRSVFNVNINYCIALIGSSLVSGTTYLLSGDLDAAFAAGGVFAAIHTTHWAILANRHPR
jgi:hypothetical protein